MITLKSWQQVKAYFSDIGYSHPVLKTQLDGRGMVIDYPDRRLDREGGSLTEYPLLEIAPPRYTGTVISGGRRSKKYQIQISVLQACPFDDARVQELAHETLEPVLDQVISKMLHDKVMRPGSFDVFSISNESHDNLWGWAVSFPMEVAEDYCYKSSGWVDVLRFNPVWIEGQTLITIFIEGQKFSVDWTENTYEAKKKAMAKLAELIDQAQGVSAGAFSSLFFSPAVFDTGGTSGADLDAVGDPDPTHLVVVGTEAGTKISFSFSQTGHTWEEISTSWL